MISCPSPTTISGINQRIIAIIIIDNYFYYYRVVIYSYLSIIHIIIIPYFCYQDFGTPTYRWLFSFTKRIHTYTIHAHILARISTPIRTYTRIYTHKCTQFVMASHPGYRLRARRNGPVRNKKFITSIL